MRIITPAAKLLKDSLSAKSAAMPATPAKATSEVVFSPRCDNAAMAMNNKKTVRAIETINPINLRSMCDVPRIYSSQGMHQRLIK